MNEPSVKNNTKKNTTTTSSICYFCKVQYTQVLELDLLKRNSFLIIVFHLVEENVRHKLISN